jgi:hypothetical protein
VVLGVPPQSDWVWAAAGMPAIAASDPSRTGKGADLIRMDK